MSRSMSAALQAADTSSPEPGAAGLKMSGLNLSTRYRGALRTGSRLLLIGVLAAQLGGCFPLAAAGIAAGTMAATDRRTLGAQADDKGIEIRTSSRIGERYGERVHVDVSSYNRKVLLTGQVPDAATKAAVESIAGGVESVVAVVNEVELTPPSSLSTRTTDALITGQVKAALVDAQDIFANSFKVVTERGTVYLMGRVTQREGNRAGDIARSLRGVQRVVKVFDYVTEQELANLRTQPAPGNPAPPPPRP